MAFNVSRMTHKYLIEPLSQCTHPKVLMCSRYMKFVDSLISCKKPEIRFLAELCMNDKRTVMGQNLSKIAENCGLPEKDINSLTVKENMRAYPVPDNEMWRVDMLNELILCRQFDFLTLDDFEMREIEDLLQIVCES